MPVRFSLVYPTRHRPAFVAQALGFLERQQYKDFEIIVSDNFIDPTLSCEKQCRDASLTNLKYVRPLAQLSMVENWNYALQFATGDYVCYFTDKMFLLPHTLSLASLSIEASQSDIVTWVDDEYYPTELPNYFGEGTYTKAAPSVLNGTDFVEYDPREELSKKGRADVSRSEQDKSSYARGKICFGAYSIELCQRIVAKCGNLFHNLSPDYTSMILGCSMATTAAESSLGGIVHLQTDLSNGGKSSTRDDLLLTFLHELGCAEEIIANLLVPGLYCAGHNSVAHDYLALRARYGLDFAFDRINWLVYITEDVDLDRREWSSLSIEKQMRTILRDYVSTLDQHDRERYEESLEQRAVARNTLRRRTEFNRKIRSMLPDVLIESARRISRRPRQFHCGTITDVLDRFHK